MRINKQYNKRGFTLTELIIVIVIIGILAAVLIPTLTNYIDRARLSNDNSNARNLNMILSLEALEDDVAFYDAEYVIQLALNNGYDLKASAKNYAYWYDYTRNQIVVDKIDNLEIRINAVSKNPELDTNYNYNPYNKIRSLVEDHVYIDQGSSNLSKAINLLANFVDEAITIAETTNQSKVINIMNQLFTETINEDKLGSDIADFLLQFSPDTTIYTKGNLFFTSTANIDNTTNKIINIKNIVFDKNSVDVPIFGNRHVVYNSDKIYIPVNMNSTVDLAILISRITYTGKLQVVTSNPKQYDILTSGNFNTTKYGFELCTVAPNPKQILALEFKYQTADLTNVTGAPLEVVTLASGTNYTVVLNVNGTPLMSEGSYLDVSDYISGIVRVCDVKIFDKFGVLYARGVLTYKY